MKALTIELAVIVGTLTVLGVGVYRAVNAEALTVKPLAPTQTLQVKPIDEQGRKLYAEDLQGGEDCTAYELQPTVSDYILSNATKIQ